ncbi:hypothetical protein ACIP5N_21350 [Streptomyces sp. NPDC088768]|uniref:zinc finger domain-containing protein n=1 Tax=Streptomyces sp. NPDC088768 TaxID=3365894 RepID=UPI003827813E
MTRRIGRGGRTGQTYKATPGLRDYTVPPASPVTVTRADGSSEVVPAEKAKKPARRPVRGPLVCAWCGYPIQGRSGRDRGKPIHPDGNCPKQESTRPKPPSPQTATKTAPAAASPPPQRPARATAKESGSTAAPPPPRSAPRSGSSNPYKSPNTRAVPPEKWIKVTCPRCGAEPGKRCFGLTLQGTVKAFEVPHTERPQVVRRAYAAAQRRAARP